MGFRGCKDVKMISHGEWNDPELSFTDDRGTTYYANYWEIEDAMYGFYEESKEDEELKEIYEFDDSDEDFDKFVQNYEDEVIGLIVDCATEIVKKGKRAKKDHSEHIPLDYQFSEQEMNEMIEYANAHPKQVKKMLSEF